METRKFAWPTLIACVLLISVFGLPVLAADQVEITLGYKGQPAETQIAQRIFNEFLAQHPGVKGTFVDMTATDGPWTQKLQAMIAAGVQPDVTRMEYMVSLPIAMQGSLRPLDEFIARDTQFDIRDFHPNALQPHRWNGKLWGIPREAVTMPIYYNRDLFDRSGLAYPTSSWDLPRFLDIAKRLTRDVNGDGTPDTWGYHFMWNYVFWLVMGHNNGFFDFNPDTGELTLDRPGAIQGLQAVQDMIYKLKVAPNPSIPGVSFDAGNVGMTYQGPWMVPGWRALPFDWDIAEVPQIDGQRYTVTGFDAFQMSATTKHPDLSWELIKYMTSAKVQMEEAKLGGIVPSRLSVARSSGWWDPKERPHTVEPYIRGLDYARPMAVTHSVAYSGDVSQKIGQVMQRVFDGQVPAAVAVNEIAPAIRAAARK